MVSNNMISKLTYNHPIMWHLNHVKFPQVSQDCEQKTIHMNAKIMRLLRYGMKVENKCQTVLTRLDTVLYRS